ncbi:MAG: Cell division protein CpoB [Thermodesulfobacteria bacterium]|nr:tol-pal system protein YbgF [Thermodesulfobacteriota bacterium]MCU4138023.1 Cell division protein CpoB [Thermodesulfobacteriota bacterium]
MKKSFFKFLLLLIPLILNGCVAYQEEFQTLKIKVINLEAIVNKQNQKYEEMEKRLNVIDKKITSLESKISKDVLVDIKTQILSDLEDIKYQQALLSSQLEDLKFSKEEQDKEFTDRLNNLFTQVQALQLRIKEIEKKLGITPKVVSNETAVVSNETISSNETAILSTNATNATNTNATITQVEKPLTEVELYEKAYSSYQQGDFKNARKLFEEYIEKFPKGKWIGQAYFWIGESYFKEKKYEEAILSYQKLIELQGWHPLKPTAMFKQAQAFKALGDIEAYKILLKKVINQYPNSKEAKKAKKLLRK